MRKFRLISIFIASVERRAVQIGNGTAGRSGYNKIESYVRVKHVSRYHAFNIYRFTYRIASSATITGELRFGVVLRSASELLIVYSLNDNFGIFLGVKYFNCNKYSTRTEPGKSCG